MHPLQKTFRFLTGAVVLVLLGSTGCSRRERFSPPAGLSPPFTLSELKVEFTHNPLPPFLILSSPGKRSEFREGKGIWIRLGEKEVGEDCIYSFRTRIPLEIFERGFKARVSFRVHRFSADDLCVGFQFSPPTEGKILYRAGGCLIRSGDLWHLRLDAGASYGEEVWAIPSPELFSSFSLEDQDHHLVLSSAGRTLTADAPSLPSPLFLEVFFLTGVIHPEKLPDKKVELYLQGLESSFKAEGYFLSLPQPSPLFLFYDPPTHPAPLPLSSPISRIPADGERDLHLYFYGGEPETFLLSPLPPPVFLTLHPLPQTPRKIYPHLFTAQGKGQPYRQGKP